MGRTSSKSGDSSGGGTDSGGETDTAGGLHTGEAPVWVGPCRPGGQGDGVAASDVRVIQVCPVLHAFMTMTVVRGKPRKPGSLTLFCEDGKIKGALTDREMGMVAFLSSEGFLGLVEGLEKGLKGGTLDWRPGKKR